MDSVINLLIRIALMVLAGFIAKRVGLLDKDFQSKLSRLLLGLVIPASILSSGNISSAWIMVGNLVWVAEIAIGYYIVALLLLWVLAKGLCVPLDKTGVFKMMAVFANTGFMGLPIIFVLYGQEGMLYGIVYNLVAQCFHYTAGVAMLMGDIKVDWRSIILNPLTIISVASILLFISPFRLPAVAVGAMEDIGAMTVPISMIIIGGTFAGQSFKSVFSQPLSYVVSALRLLVMPLVMLLLVRFLELDAVLVNVCVVLTAMPAGALNVLFAEQYHKDSEFAAVTVIQGMALLPITLPIILVSVGI